MNNAAGRQFGFWQKHPKWLDYQIFRQILARRSFARRANKSVQLAKKAHSPFCKGK
jgi:hypothetical protein